MESKAGMKEFQKVTVFFFFKDSIGKKRCQSFKMDISILLERTYYMSGRMIFMCVCNSFFSLVLSDYICVYVGIYMCVQIYICVCVCAYTCTYTYDTYTYIIPYKKEK